MADDSEIYGRKVFFLNPSYSVKKDILPKLMENEYEIYIIENYRDAKNILRRCRNSLLFINVDGQLSIPAWFNFVRSFEKEEVLETTFITLISDRIKQQESELFLNIARVPGGVLDLNEEGTEGIKNRITKILDEAKAKGQRQYVRADLTYDKEASVFWNHGNKMYELKLLDISSVGMAVSVPQVLAQQIIAKNFLLQNVTLRLGLKQVVVDCVIYAVKQGYNTTTWILLLLPSTPTSVKNEIRAYVSLSIQKDLIKLTNEAKTDEVDYNTLAYYGIATKQKITSGTMSGL